MDVKSDLAEFVKKLLSIVPPYDRVAYFLRECKSSRDFNELAKLYQEFFEPEVFSIVHKLLGISIKSGRVYLEKVGYYLNSLVESTFELFDDDEFRAELSKYIGEEIPNPLRDYVKACVDGLSQNSEFIEIMRILLERGYRSDKLRDELSRRGFIVGYDSLRNYVKTLERLGLVKVTWYSDGGFYCYLHNRIRRHLKELI